MARIKTALMVVLAVVLGAAIGLTDPQSEKQLASDNPGDQLVRAAQPPQLTSPNDNAGRSSSERSTSRQVVTLDQAPSSSRVATVNWLQPQTGDQFFNVVSLRQQLLDTTNLTIPIRIFEPDPIPVRSDRPFTVRVRFSGGGGADQRALNRLELRVPGAGASAATGAIVSVVGQDDTYDVTFQNFPFSGKQVLQMTAVANNGVQIPSSHSTQAIQFDSLVPTIGGTTHSQFRRPVAGTPELYINNETSFLRFESTSPLGHSGMKAFVAFGEGDEFTLVEDSTIEVDRASDRTGTFIGRTELPVKKRNDGDAIKVLLVSRTASGLRLGDKLISGMLKRDPIRMALEITHVDDDSIVDVKNALFRKSLSKVTINKRAGINHSSVDLVVYDSTANAASRTLAVFSDEVTSSNTIELTSSLVGTGSVQTVDLDVVAYLGNTIINAEAKKIKVSLLDRPLEVSRLRHDQVGVVAGANKIVAYFPSDQPLNLDHGVVESTTWNALNLGNELSLAAPLSEVDLTAEEIKYNAADNSLVFTYPASNVLAGDYVFQFNGESITDRFGNTLADFEKRFGRTPGQYTENALPGRVMPGIHGATGEYVSYQEFGPPREVPDGFNPNDKVETRVARLYFYRDAHRVAQIINRKVESHNRHGVSVTRQLAENARTKADELTAARQQAEREAIRKAQESRQIESKLSDARRNFDRTLSSLQQDVVSRNARRENLPATGESGTGESDRQLDQLEQSIVAKENAARTFSQQVSSLESQLDSARQAEADAREQAEQKESEEQRARQEQFRREVAAAHADPDTYAEGVPDSSDPVEQTTISVIGEGLIHLRGPLKGVNQIRLMIDQIDSPVGQVRVNLHSTQINGDDAERLEVVSSRIQTYIDQARFLTVQTGEMLRKSVMIVAAQRAEEARHLFPGASQRERDQRYLHAFFGKDFVDELQTIDSEFLHTGNKLISLHSMDVTSLSSALLLLSLSNNSTRQMILQEFERQMREELPVAEQKFLYAGMHVNGQQCECLNECDECGNEKKFGNRLRRLWKKNHGPPPLYTLAQNAEFQSLKGFFDGILPHDHTMTPLQREFVRLAQIFKSRLITELEYKQRVMERALIEDRLGNRQQELLDAQALEDEAAQLLERSQKEKANAIQQVVIELTRAQGRIRQSTAKAIADVNWFRTNYREFIRDMRDADNQREIAEFKKSSARALPQTIRFYGTILDGVDFDVVKSNRQGAEDAVVYVASSIADSNIRRVESVLRDTIQRALGTARSLMDFNSRSRTEMSFELNAPQNSGIENVHAKLKIVEEYLFIQPSTSDSRLMLRVESLQSLADCMTQLERYVHEAIEVQDKLANQRIELMRRLQDPDSDFEGYFLLWQNYRSTIAQIFGTHPDGAAAIEALGKVDRQFDQLLEIDVRTKFRLREATEKRRPLDHKKFLDMLIDDLEEKYIELLEGTRAHTANIDNYLKRLTTALDDDFNTQFYNPTFRNVREGSQFRDVEFGQTETTNVLANNREFAKVSPSATMEFDLPKRDILIKEGIDSALAIYNDVGALVNDPNLMALAASQSGNSPADIGAGAAGGFGSVRNVLPGLSGDTQEGVLAQASGTRPRFESNVEQLIPDPAIYKFETGTGFEIRPVIEPDGQAVVFDFNYMYTTNVREPVAADEKHLGRVKRHFIDTDVQLSNFELREVSRYVVALKAERTARGVPLLEDVPVVGALWRPLPSKDKSLQQNIIMAQATIFPTLFDLMGLRWAPAVADLDPLRLSNREFIVRGRHRFLENRVYDVSSSRVDEFLRVPEAERRGDLYRSQSSIPSTHPNGYRGPGLDLRDSQLREGHQTDRAYPPSQYIPDRSREGAYYRGDQPTLTDEMPIAPYTMQPQFSEESFPEQRLPEERYSEGRYSEKRFSEEAYSSEMIESSDREPTSRSIELSPLMLSP